MIHADLIPSSIFDRAPSPEAAREIWDGMSNVPGHFQGRLLDNYERKAAAAEGDAIGYLYNAVRELSAKSLDLAASDSEVCEFAQERANEVRSLMMATTQTSSQDMTCLLRGYALEFGAVLPDACKVTLGGTIARMTDAAWWRRQLRRNVARQVEAHAIGLGFVHRRAGLYASDESVKRHGEQQQRNRRALESTIATNEEGYEATLAELSEVGVSNPRIRRGELMTRIAGFEGCAKSASHVGMFYTCTAPSRMHPRLSVSGQENPKYDGTTPKDCAGYLSKTWAKARAWLHRRGINIYGFRVAEPHHDGTPHWHMLFFMLPAVVESVTYCIKRYFTETDAHELTTAEAQGARFNVKKIDWAKGSAAGYIAKYIAKNIDGKNNDLAAVGDDYEAAEPVAADQTAPRVLAWSSTWGIRQFQQIGGPGVTVWRELRRIRDMKQGDLFDTWSAADTGNWQEFTERQGGAVCARKDRPVQLWSEAVPGKANRYGEQATPEVIGVQLVKRLLPVVRRVNYETRRHVWEIRRKNEDRKGYSCSEGKGKEDLPIRGNGNRGFVLGAEGEECANTENGLFVVREAKRQGVFGEEVAGRGKGLEGFLAPKAPWSPVNNCTPSEDADGFKIGAPMPAPEIKPGFDNPAAMVKKATREAVLNFIESKRKRGAFGQFPRLSNA